MIVKPFEAWHLDELTLQDSQSIFEPSLVNSGYGLSLQTAGPAYSAVIDDKVIACLGIIPQWENRAIAWGLISGDAGKYFIGVHKAVKRFLDLQDYARIETSVSCNFDQGHRWAQMLGFEREGMMRKYTPDGRDCDLYARIR
jgi:hypothetical protein